jgi:hypothetical protein
MGFELYRMVRDGAPASWTALMRLVAGVIADGAWDPSQEPPDDDGCSRSAMGIRGDYRNGKWHDGLTERTGMSERAISRVLTDLAGAGYEMRVQVDTDKRGRPVFAYPGRALRFRVPLLAARPCPPDSATITASGRGAKVADFGSDGRRIRRASRGSPNSASLYPLSPTTPQRLNGPVVNRSLEPRARDGQTGDTGAERRRQEKALAEWIRDHPEPPESTSAGSTGGENTP